MAFVSDRRTSLLRLASIVSISSVLVASNDAHADPRRTCPTDMALVGDSCIDRWEASLVEVKKDGTEKPWSPYYTPMGHVVRAVSKPGVVPQGHISMALAWNACKKAGKRLCHADEWVAACRGPQDSDWPYGAVRAPGTCIDANRTYALGKLHPGDEMYENRTMNDPRLNQVENTVALTGSALTCTNEYGVFDMVGNVNEWIDDKTMRGGFYFDVDDLGEGCNYATKVHSKVYNDYSTGFRCCMDAPYEAQLSNAKLQHVLELAFDVSMVLEPTATMMTSLTTGTLSDAMPAIVDEPPGS